QRAVELAAKEDHIVVMGVQPARAETGYGYIETGDKIESELFHVKRFTEKPNQQRAEEFMNAGNYYWNSGIFVWSAAPPPARYVSIFLKPRRFLMRLPPPGTQKISARNSRSFIPSVKTSALIMRCWSLVSPKGSTRPIFFACAPTLAGMILVPGPLSMSITLSITRTKPKT